MNVFVPNGRVFELAVADKDVSSSVLFFTGRSLSRDGEILVVTSTWVVSWHKWRIGGGERLFLSYWNKGKWIPLFQEPRGLNVFRSIKKKRKLNVKRSPCWLKSEIRNKAGMFLHLSHVLIVLLSSLCRVGCYRECSDRFRLLKMLVINMD